MRLEFAAKAGHSGSHDASPKFLGMVVGTLKEMVGIFVLDSKARVVSVSVCLKRLCPKCLSVCPRCLSKCLSVRDILISPTSD
jgi:hypothetical protein